MTPDFKGERQSLAGASMVVLVNRLNKPVGEMPKLEAHQKGILHSAFSVFIFSTDHQMLLQQRAMGKYHSGGLWSNACCSHPRPSEVCDAAAHERLWGEMGIRCQLSHQYQFEYAANVGNGLVEHELDQVYFGTSDADPQPDPEEVQQWRRAPLDQILAELQDPEAPYSPWFRIAFPRVRATYLALTTGG